MNIKKRERVEGGRGEEEDERDGRESTQMERERVRDMKVRGNIFCSVSVRNSLLFKEE